MLKIKLFALP